MTVRDGYYEYNIKFSTLLRTPEDVQNIYIRNNYLELPDKRSGKSSCRTGKRDRLIASQRKRAVTLAVIKQADENMEYT